MKKRTNYLLIITGVILFVPFQLCKFIPKALIPEQYLHLLGIAAMLGVIIFMVALLGLCSKIEFKMVNKNNGGNDNDKELVK